MTTSSLDEMKANALDSYIDWSPEEIAMINATKSETELHELMYDLVEKHSTIYYTGQGMSEGEARAKARANRRKAGG